MLTRTLNKLRLSWAAACAACCAAGWIPAISVAQVYVPQPQPGYQLPPEPHAAATLGNPFVRRGLPRATLLSSLDDRVVPASFEQSLPQPANVAASPMTSMAGPVPTPTPSVAPPARLPASTAAPLPMPSQAVPSQPMPSQPLVGTAMLTQQAGGAAAGEHPLAPVVRWAEAALQQTQGLHDYACTFSKREFIDGRLQDQQVMFAKVRHQPYSVYLQFLAPGDVKGQEAMYVAGQNGGKLLAHPVGFKQAIVGTISLDPTEPRAMDGNRYPITDFGLRRLLERYLAGSVQDMQFGECEVQIIDNARVNDRPCVCIQVVHPVRRREFRNHLMRLYVDHEWNLPVRYEGYDWPSQPGGQSQLVEEYTYQGLQLNLGLGDGDFDTRNPNYRF